MSNSTDSPADPPRAEPDKEHRRVWRRDDAKYIALLLALVAMFVLSPLLQGQLLGIRLLDVFLVAVFCAAVFAVSRRRLTLFVGVVLAVAVLATTIPQKFMVPIRLLSPPASCSPRCFSRSSWRWSSPMYSAARA